MSGHDMTRIALVIVAFLAVLWMILPQVHESGTEMGFPPGSPDPNVYKTTWSFGWPVAWIAWERSWNAAAGYDEAGFRSFKFLNLAVHVAAILAPLLLLFRLSRSGKRAGFGEPP
jgi:hypothetical protein